MLFEDAAVKAADLLLLVFLSTLILIVAWGALWIRTVKKPNHPLYYISKGKEKKQVQNVEPYTIFRAVVNCLKEEKDRK
ncbi:MAG: hypothetical protein OEW62_07035 [Candidatus Bathyarchaeota archaeon]|nr:hypothetical protein [Candidatus Bathyarchaeota archaeon]MDH5595662.1 hypothetical protein [Candidatus Bathyarchaeota archaeon]